MQGDTRLAERIGEDFQLPPADRANPGAEQLADRFLGGEAPGQPLRALVAVPLLVGCIDAVKEPLPMALQGLSDAWDLRRIDAADGDQAVRRGWVLAVRSRGGDPSRCAWRELALRISHGPATAVAWLFTRATAVARAAPNQIMAAVYAQAQPPW